MDYKGRHRKPAADVLIALVNRRGGHDFTTAVSVSEVRKRATKLKAEKIEQLLPSVIVAWGGRLPPLWIWAGEKTQKVRLTLKPDCGAAQSFDLQPAEVLRRKKNYRLRFDLPEKIDFGCYEVSLKTDRGARGESYLIAAPDKLENEGYSWGGFAPAYALHDHKTGPVGGYRELKQAARFIREQGGGFIGTLPLLPLFYEGADKEISPYTPVSRLFWNELFLDLSKLPGVKNTELPKPEKQQNHLVDYDQSHARVKAALIMAANQFFNKYPKGDAGFKSFKRRSPLLEDYASLMAGKTADRSYNRGQMYRYHLYVQYACHVQLQDFKAAAAADKIASLYLDHTVGVHPRGFDATRYQNDFLTGLTIGAPPDMMFRGGQNWGFSPPDPTAQIRDRFSYLRACFCHYFRYAKIVRIDHIMGLQRLYCIPVDDTAKQGSYLYYPLEAQLALLCLIAYQQDGILIGEDLGTVSKRLRTSMTRRGINRMWVGQFSLRRNWQKSFAGLRQNMMACLNTHDMFPFRAFIDGADISRFAEFGLIDQKEEQRQQKQRAALLKNLKAEPDPYLACLEKMADSKARYLMINFEDLWEESEPQNIPGIAQDYPNWQKKFSQPIDVWGDLPKVKQAVKILNQYRSHNP